MQYLTFLWHGLGGLRELWKFMQDMDKRGVRRFSDTWAREVRKWLETRILTLCMYEDTWLAKRFGTFGQMLRCGLIILKSNSLAAVEAAQGDDKKLQEAIVKLGEKQTDYPKPCDPTFHGNHP